MTVLTAIREIVFLIYILVVSPYLLGNLLFYKLEDGILDSYVLRYVIGFFSQLGIWGTIALANSLIADNKWPLHILFELFALMMLMVSIIWIVLMTKEKKTLSARFIKLRSKIQQCKTDSLTIRLLFIFSISVVLIQLLQIILCARTAYDDTNVYSSVINNSLYSDIDSVGGWVKYDLAPWIMYIAFISYVGRQHPIFINGTIIPLVALLIYHLIVFIMGRFLFHDNHRSSILFWCTSVLAVAVLGYASYGNEYMLTHSVAWGKVILGGAFIPYIVVLYNLAVEQAVCTKQYDIRLIAALLLSGLGGAWLSIMAIMILSLGILLMTITSFVNTKKVYSAVYGALAGMGVFSQAIIYLIHYGIGQV